MILRLILVLLAACLPLPAAAAPCHAPAVATHGHHAPQKPEPAAPAHLCIGCVPIGDWLRAPVAAPMPSRVLPLEMRVARLDLGGAQPPALPPPRGA